MMGAYAEPQPAPPLNKQPRRRGGMMGGGMGGGMGGSMGGGMMMESIGLPEEQPALEQYRVLGEDASPENISDEVRKELQRILPGLLREILPKLLAEAMTEAAGNNDLPDEDGYSRGMR